MNSSTLSSQPPASAPTTAEHQQKKKDKGIYIPEILANDIGLKTWFSPKAGHDTNVDIVAVHGLGVSPKDTWTHPKTKCNWLKDESMLPSTLPEARIMSYCYDSRWMGENAVKSSLEGVATKLLRALSHERRNCPERPIVFIGHCLGGLVIQQAYLSIWLQQEDWENVTTNNINGIVFLGTPHRGVSDGTLSTQGKLYDAILASNTRVEKNILNSMERNNDVLVSVVHNFTRRIHNTIQRPQLYCFYEEVETRVGMVVGLDLPSEYLVDISSGTLSGHQKEGLTLDHFRMNKFEGKEDGNYVCVSRVIAEMASKAPAKSIQDTKTAAARFARVREIPTLPAPIATEDNFAPRSGLLEAIDTKFHASGRVALYGPPGTGKTHIAVEYAHKYHRDHPASHVHWVNANSPEQFESSYTRIAEDLHLVNGATDVGKIIETVHQHLRYDSSGHWLMILDGLEDDATLKATSPTHSGSSLLDFIPNSVHSSILITTQSKSLALRQVGLDNENAVQMPNLTEEDASILLLGVSTKDADKQEWIRGMLDALDGVAIGLNLAQIYQKEADTTIKARKLLDMVRSQKTEIGGTARAWNLLFDLLKKNHPELIDFMLLLGAIDLPIIPSAMLERAQVKTRVPVLVKYGMVEPSKDRRVYFITTSIRKCIRDRLSKSPDDKAAIEELALRTMCKKFNMETGVSLLPCALAVSKFEPPSSSGKISRAQLLFAISEHFERLEQHTRALACLEQCLELREGQVEIPNKGLLVTETKEAIERNKKLSLGNEQVKKTLKGAGKSVGQTEKKLEKLAASDKFGENHEDTVRMASELAALQLVRSHKKGPNDPSILYERVLEWFKSKHGAEDVGMARHQYNLALSYDKKDQYEKAEKLYQSALETVNKASDSHESLSLRFKILGNLISLYALHDCLDDAEEVSQTLLQDQVHLLGPDHPETLITRHNACILLQERGMLGAAKAELKQILDAQRALLQPDDPATFRTACSLALTLRLLGEKKAAERLFKEVLATQKKVLGSDHNDTIRTKTMLTELQEHERKT